MEAGKVGIAVTHSPSGHLPSVPTSDKWDILLPLLHLQVLSDTEPPDKEAEQGRGLWEELELQMGGVMVASGLGPGTLLVAIKHFVV